METGGSPSVMTKVAYFTVVSLQSLDPAAAGSSNVNDGIVRVSPDKDGSTGKEIPDPIIKLL